ncbi:MAG: Crp/Fnr family transcriptional regulator [Calditrichaeota bacterium]|nr:Crp/Fnr family transcriptional regulator [Calditrichota bacterium]
MLVNKSTYGSAYNKFFRFLRSVTEIPDAEVEKISGIFKYKKLDKGEFFIRAGERPQTIGFIISGILRLYYLKDDGGEFTKSFCVENEMVAAYSALLLKEQSRLYIEALEDSSLLVASYESYEKISSGHICWQIINQKLAEALFIKKEKRESELLLDDAKTRYLKFLDDYPGLEKKVKQHHIASYLGITPVSLSRIRSKLKLT